MKKLMKKFIATFLVVAIILCSAPLSGLVGLELPSWFDLSIKTFAAETSGTCGENLTWEFDETTGTLTILGTGIMSSYIYMEQLNIMRPPWESYSSEIESVIVDDGVTSVGDFAFYNCKNLTQVILPDGLTTIGDSSFSNCSLLNEIVIPNTVYEIHDYAFCNCISITDIILPERCSIGDGVFSGCTSLETFYVGLLSSSIGVGTFYGCTSLQNVTINGMIVTCHIKAEAFMGCTSLKSIVIPGGTFNIGNSAFRDCTGLEIVSLGNFVSTIDNNAFFNCTRLTDVYYSGSEEEWGEIEIGDGNDCLRNANMHYDYTENTQDNEIAVFSTEKSLNVITGDSFKMGFGLLNCNTGYLDGEWKQMSIVISNPTIIDVSDYEKVEWGYFVNITGKKEGSTNVTITDTETGTTIDFVVTVYDNYSKSYSYDIANMSRFYPNNKFEDHIETNIYNLNGLYMNNYSCTKISNGYNISFDMYNSKHHHGAIDIYDADGNWIGCEIIERFSQIDSIWETGEQAYYLISNVAALIPGGNSSNLLTYEQESFSKKTSISIFVPEGGYFTVSNNFSQSPGTFLFNSCEIMFKGVSALLNYVASDTVEISEFSKLICGNITDNKVTRDLFIEIFMDTARDEIVNYSKCIVDGQMDSAYSGISELLENMLNSLEISWKHLFSTVTGVGEAVFTKVTGPVGVALTGCFAISKYADMLFQSEALASSLGNTYAAIYSSTSDISVNQHGVVVNTAGNMDTEAVLQVFKISNNESSNSLVDCNNPLEDCTTYNISFVKNDTLVQPSGFVTVKIPIPKGMNSSTCKIYRQEADGNWTTLDAHIEGNYLVFETDHFSLYSIVGEMTEISLKKLPNKLEYFEGDILDTTGLELELNGEVITEGYICSPTVLSDVGTQTITITYCMTTTSFTVVVYKTPSIIEEMSSQIRFDTNEDGSYAGTFDVRTRAKILDEDFNALIGSTNAEAQENIDSIGFVYTLNGENFSAESAQAVAQGKTVAGYVNAPVKNIQDCDGYYMFTCLITDIPEFDRNYTLTAYAYICVNGKWYFANAPVDADLNSLYSKYYPLACEKYGWTVE